MKQKIIVIVGPTASGKTSLAIDIAQMCGGEVISADSRQVYRDLDIGTEKVSIAEMQGVPHHLIDIIDPEETYTAADFKRDAKKAIGEISNRGHIPIIAGGTFFYIESLLGGHMLPEVPPNENLRKELEQKTNTELYKLLEEKDPERAKTIDPHNTRRLIRALEIAEALGTVPQREEAESFYDAYVIGIDIEKEVLKERIGTRLNDTLTKGLIEETQKLLERGLEKERLNEIGLEYRVVLQHIESKIDVEKMQNILEQKLWQYAKRQRTWLSNMKDVHWYTPEQKETLKKDIATFLK